MKKLMIVGAIVLAASFAQAAKVQWSTGAMCMPNPDGSWSSITADSDDWKGSMSAVITFFSDADHKNEVTGVSNTSADINAISSAIGKTTSDSFTGLTTYYAEVLITYTGDAGVQTLAIDNIEFDTPKTGTKVVNLQNLGFLDNTMKFTAVPEPTSGLLLLLGVAGLALKRRRA